MGDEAQLGRPFQQLGAERRTSPPRDQHLRLGEHRKGRAGRQVVQDVAVKVGQLGEPVEGALGEDLLTHARRHRQDGARSEPRLHDRHITLPES
ncbi:hypothetical protein [Nonomuraea dietziae]|uniref:hypothetical protein n=1 Tax=Nonomuraea dietziae TaxID=65515 RepID=UPI0031E35548